MSKHAPIKTPAWVTKRGEVNAGGPKTGETGETLARRGEDSGGEGEPGKPPIEIEPHILARFQEAWTRIHSMQANGRDAGQTVGQALGSDREKAGWLRSAILAGLSVDLILSVVEAHNARGAFAVGRDDVGVEMRVELRRLALGQNAGIEETEAAPSSNAIDRRTGKPYGRAEDGTEALRRLREDGVGIAGNLLDPQVVERAKLAVTKRPAGYLSAASQTVFLVFANLLDNPDDPRRASDYAELTPDGVVAGENRLAGHSPSGGER